MVEGGLETIEVTGLARLSPEYVRDRIQLRAQPPLQQAAIEDALRLLQQDPLIDRIDAQTQRSLNRGSAAPGGPGKCR